MKLYEFTSSKWSKQPSFKMEEYEAEEKAKTYSKPWGRVNKSDIGCVSGFDKNSVFLLENNPSLAAEILLKQKELELSKLEEQVNRSKYEITMLKGYIK